MLLSLHFVLKEGEWNKWELLWCVAQCILCDEVPKIFWNCFCKPYLIYTVFSSRRSIYSITLNYWPFTQNKQQLSVCSWRWYYSRDTVCILSSVKVGWFMLKCVMRVWCSLKLMMVSNKADIASQNFLLWHYLKFIYNKWRFLLRRESSISSGWEVSFPSSSSEGFGKCL